MGMVQFITGIQIYSLIVNIRRNNIFKLSSTAVSDRKIRVYFMYSRGNSQNYPRMLIKNKLAVFVRLLIFWYQYGLIIEFVRFFCSKTANSWKGSSKIAHLDGRYAKVHETTDRSILNRRNTLIFIAYSYELSRTRTLYHSDRSLEHKVRKPWWVLCT